MNKHVMWIFLALVSLMLIAQIGCGSAEESGTAGEGREQKIAEITDQTFLPSALTFSEDFRHIAYAVRVGKRQRVVVDGENQEVYDGIMIGTPLFMGDSDRVIYIAKDNAPGSDKEGEDEEEAKREGEKWYVVRDGKSQKKYDFILPYSLKVSPDAGRMVYAARLGARHVLVDGEREFEGGEGIDVKSIVFSEDGSRLIYSYRNERQFYVSDTQNTFGPYVFLDGESIVISDDGRHVAYVVRDKDRKTFIVVDGKELGPYNRTVGLESQSRRRPGPMRGRDMMDPSEKKPKDLRFTEDGRLLFYGLREGTIYRVLVDLD